ncbi:hypothetical protein [Undibacterium sp. TS12]|uniref:hypothetical protein n=1 Tax=Undibacterium sp. TS12 TaxID=2908202 RepID=UPI001F4C889E|nr:hypothetical protein [Undibacterium sp. TS12]MCH8617497.1 hypothetical protein [Undibacterium sp. TS12]
MNDLEQTMRFEEATLKAKDMIGALISLRSEILSAERKKNVPDLGLMVRVEDELLALFAARKRVTLMTVEEAEHEVEVRRAQLQHETAGQDADLNPRGQ